MGLNPPISNLVKERFVPDLCYAGILYDGKTQNLVYLKAKMSKLLNSVPELWLKVY